jgi:hypothetical protein
MQQPIPQSGTDDKQHHEEDPPTSYFHHISSQLSSGQRLLDTDPGLAESYFGFLGSAILKSIMILSQKTSNGMAKQKAPDARLAMVEP